ncbi:hypothetical protein L914_08405 [Phytophthora nicotianae]|uniref:Uncharacterized protein n=1 Tax=Phytophthora nicotianae TaxID=4792 RepID=W2NDW3_PHYNI|nr:hypothetical protein L914_08405 [Phytophthora nicotianae]
MKSLSVIPPFTSITSRNATPLHLEPSNTSGNYPTRRIVSYPPSVLMARDYRRLSLLIASTCRRPHRRLLL